MFPSQKRLHVSLIAIPDAVISTLSGLYDVLNAFAMLTPISDAVPAEPPFVVEIAGRARGPLRLASGLNIDVVRRVDEVEVTDIVIVPSVLVGEEGWQKDRYPDLVAWLIAMHAQGAVLCSACSGIFLLAETGLYDHRESTVHWVYANAFRHGFPNVPLYPERALVASGVRQEFISSGASTSWHDLVLYLIARYVGVAAAQAVAKFFALQWHDDGLAPYFMFQPPTEHGDAVVAEAQAWLASHFAVATPVEEMVRRAAIPERSFKRRFTQATGYTPIAYVQHLRVEDAKRRLERTRATIDEISWRVGYEDPAFFRRLFKRITGITPGTYRKKFQLPYYKSDPPS